MDLWSLIIERTIFTQLENYLSQSFSDSTARLSKSQARENILRLRVREFDSDVVRSKVLRKDRYHMLIVFEKNDRIFKCTFSEKDFKLIDRSVMDVATS